MPNIDKTQMDLAPKQFCDASMAGFSKEYFVILVGSGEIINGFVFNPSHLKQFFNSLATIVKTYEEKNGEIKVEDQPILSPIQIGGN